MGIRLVVVLAELLFGIVAAQGFLLLPCPVVAVVQKSSTSTTIGASHNNAAEPAPNKAMEFLRKVGRVGNNQDFTNAIGVDEGPSGKAKGGKLEKAGGAIRACIETGIIDDMQEQFPSTSCGTTWSGFTDQVMGGVSMARLTREVFDGQVANVLRGHVKMDNNGGFIQMATNLKRDGTSVDVSTYEGLELLVQSGSDQTESFNVHVKTTNCSRPFSSYRYTFDVRPHLWESIRLPFDEFRGRGPGAENTPFDLSTVKRLGIVAFGRPFQVELAIAGVRLYKREEPPLPPSGDMTTKTFQP